jgi:hypothetical protein
MSLHRHICWLFYYYRNVDEAGDREWSVISLTSVWYKIWTKEFSTLNQDFQEIAHLFRSCKIKQECTGVLASECNGITGTLIYALMESV